MLYIRCSFNLRHPIPPYWLHPQPPQPKIEWSGFCGRFVIRFRRQRGILMAKLRNLNELCEWWGFYGSTLYHSSLACCRQALLIASIHRAPLSKFRLPGVVVGGLGGWGFLKPPFVRCLRLTAEGLAWVPTKCIFIGLALCCTCLFCPAPVHSSRPTK